MNTQILQRKGISIERLLLLCEISRKGGIRAAVGEDSARQSLASRQMKELSEYVGTDLLRRSGRSVELTDAGKELAGMSADFFHRLESFLADVQHRPELFKLGIGDSIFQWLILPNMKRFRQTFSNIELIPYGYPSGEIVRKVKSGELDAGIVRAQSFGSETFVVEEIGKIKYKLFIPEQLHVKIGRRNTSGLISTLPFCTLTGDGEYARSMKSFFAAFNGQSSLNCSSMIQMYNAVQTGEYAAILPEKSEWGFAAGTVQGITLPELAAFAHPIVLIYRSDVRKVPAKMHALDFFKKIAGA